MEEEKRGLGIMHYALCFGPLSIILLLHFFERPINLNGLTEGVGGIALVGLAIAAVNLVMSNVLFRKKISELGTDQLTAQNIEEFKAAYVTKWALLEGAVLVNTLFYFFIEPHPALILIAVLMLLLLFVSKPKFNTL